MSRKARVFSDSKSLREGMSPEGGVLLVIWFGMGVGGLYGGATNP